MASGASATPLGLTGPIPNSPYSPPFGAAHRTTVTDDLNAYFGDTEVTFLGRFEAGIFSPDDVLDGTGADGAITGVPGTSGTWTFTPGSSLYFVIALEINGGSVGQVYAVDDLSLNAGDWDMNDIFNGGGEHPNLSHLDLYGLSGDAPGFCVTHPDLCVTSSVPEPGTLALFGFGLAGFGTWRRRRNA